jgi:hypothetical protein
MERALGGEIVDWPVYAAYDWFVENRPIDWPALFELGLGEIRHADLIRSERPHVEIVETTRQVEGGVRRDVCWITDRGELHEWHLGEWQQEFLVKRPEDYRVLCRALEDTRITADPGPFLKSEAEVGDRGVTVGQLERRPYLGRSPVMEIQVQLAGLERFAVDMADQVPALMELLELMTELKLRQFREAVKTPARYIKLWDNMSIETIGLRVYSQYMVPLYRHILEILASAGKRLLVHYDGKTRLVAEQIAALDFDGLDSLTPPPEGDMPIAEARARWPEKFFWMNPPLGWYRENQCVLAERIRQMVCDAGPRRFCLMISEDVPPDWQQTVPRVLETLLEMRRL